MNNLKKIRELKKISRTELAEKIGMTRQNLFCIEEKGRRIDYNYAKKICEILGCTYNDLYGEEININTNTDIVYIKYYDVIASAGPGFLNSTENSKLIPFDKSYLEDLGIFKRNSYSDIVILKVNGMSMFPTINNNDIIFIDINKKEINSNKIYVINENGLIKVKRIVKTNPFSENIEIKSDNTISNDYPTYSLSLLDIDLNQLIVGQVVAIVKKIID